MREIRKLGICIYRCSVPAILPPGQIRKTGLLGTSPIPVRLPTSLSGCASVSSANCIHRNQKREGRAVVECIHFCLALFIGTVTIPSDAAWRLPALSSYHRHRTAPHFVWLSAAPAFPALLPGSLCMLPFSERSTVRIPAGVL